MCPWFACKRCIAGILVRSLRHISRPELGLLETIESVNEGGCSVLDSVGRHTRLAFSGLGTKGTIMLIAVDIAGNGLVLRNDRV